MKRLILLLPLLLFASACGDGGSDADASTPESAAQVIVESLFRGDVDRLLTLSCEDIWRDVEDLADDNWDVLFSRFTDFDGDGLQYELAGDIVTVDDLRVATVSIQGAFTLTIRGNGIQVDAEQFFPDGITLYEQSDGWLTCDDSLLAAAAAA